MDSSDKGPNGMKENGIKILVVDDEQGICKLLSRLVEQEGCKALVANNGFDALKLIKSELPEILFTDLRMPGMDGIELMTKAKALDPDLPVIFITAYADVPGAVNAIKRAPMITCLNLLTTLRFSGSYTGHWLSGSSNNKSSTFPANCSRSSP
jgi:CheY-like chemotaxis protein